MSEINSEVSSAPIASQPDSKKMVQIPADTLNALFSSVESLRNEISTLRKSHSDISTQLITLQQHIGVEFSRFPRLPFELRTMIWRYALAHTPQIHVLGDSGLSRSNINAVAGSCKEAWVEAKRLQLDYLSRETNDDSPHSDYRNYVNLDIDTFWLLPTDGSDYAIIPDFVSAFCGKCVKDGSMQYFRGAQNCSRNIQYTFFPIHTLALYADSWQEPEPYEILRDATYHHSEGIIELLCQWKVQHVLIIVGDTIPSPHTEFVEPASIYPSFESEEKFLGAVAGFHTTWQNLETKVVEALQSYKDQRATDRREYYEEFGMTEEELEEQENAEGFYDLSEWRIPTVKFVRARPIDPKWIHVNKVQYI